MSDLCLIALLGLYLAAIALSLQLASLQRYELVAAIITGIAIVTASIK
jgi:hypothetical protein